MPAYVGAIDHGTTSSRFIIFDTDGNIVASHQYEFDRESQSVIKNGSQTNSSSEMFPQPG